MLFVEFSCEVLSNERKLCWFIFILRVLKYFAEFSSKIVSKCNNSKISIPETVFMVIFGILASRPFKRAPTLWVYFDFERFYDFSKKSLKSFQRAITRKLPYRKLFSLSFSESSRQELSNEPQLYGFIFILRFFTFFSK